MISFPPTPSLSQTDFPHAAYGGCIAGEGVSQPSLAALLPLFDRQGVAVEGSVPNIGAKYPYAGYILSKGRSY